MPASPDATVFAGLTIAHRGDGLSYPENTLSAIRSAFRLGADAVEVDVMRTKDRVWVAIHDETVDCTTNGRGQVESYMHSDLKKPRVKGTGLDQVPGVKESIPTLEEVIALTLALGVKLEIEMKTGIKNQFSAAQGFAKLFQKYDLYQSAFVSSFDPRFLHYLRSDESRIVTALAIKEHPPYNKIIEFLLRRDLTVDYLGIGILEPEIVLANQEFIGKWRGKKKVMNI